MNDDAAVRRLGGWLAQRTGLPCDDLSTPAARAVDLAQSRAQLEGSGRLGRLASRVLVRLEETRGRGPGGA